MATDKILFVNHYLPQLAYMSDLLAL